MHERADMWAEDMAKLLNSATPTKRKRLQDMNITILNKDESLQQQVNTKVVENVQKCRDDLKKLRSPDAKSRRQLLSDIVLGNAEVIGSSALSLELRKLSWVIVPPPLREVPT